MSGEYPGGGFGPPGSKGKGKKRKKGRKEKKKKGKKGTKRKKIGTSALREGRHLGVGCAPSYFCRDRGA